MHRALCGDETAKRTLKPERTLKVGTQEGGGEGARGRGAPSSLPALRGQLGGRRAEGRAAGLGDRRPRSAGTRAARAREGRARRAPGAPGSGPGGRRGRDPHPCRPRARRRLWSRQSSRNAAPASEELRAVKYLLKAAMAPAAASERRDGGRAGDCLRAGSAEETGRRARRRARAGPAARERPLARAAAPSPPRTLASPGARARAGERGGGGGSEGSVPRWKAVRTRGPPGGLAGNAVGRRRGCPALVRGCPRSGVRNTPWLSQELEERAGPAPRTQWALPLRHPLDASVPPS